MPEPGSGGPSPRFEPVPAAWNLSFDSIQTIVSSTSADFHPQRSGQGEKRIYPMTLADSPHHIEAGSEMTETRAVLTR